MSDDKWLETLRAACEQSSQSKIAQRLGVSAGLINQVLKGSYRHPTRSLEERVKGELMGHCVECPILGEINRKSCIDLQARPLDVTNPIRVAIFHACRSGGCPHALETTEEKA